MLGQPPSVGAGEARLFAALDVVVDVVVGVFVFVDVVSVLGSPDDDAVVAAPSDVVVALREDMSELIDRRVEAIPVSPGVCPAPRRETTANTAPDAPGEDHDQDDENYPECSH